MLALVGPQPLLRQADLDALAGRQRIGKEDVNGGDDQLHPDSQRVRVHIGIGLLQPPLGKAVMVGDVEKKVAGLDDVDACGVTNVGLSLVLAGGQRCHRARQRLSNVQDTLRPQLWRDLVQPGPHCRLVYL